MLLDDLSHATYNDAAFCLLICADSQHLAYHAVIGEVCPDYTYMNLCNVLPSSCVLQGFKLRYTAYCRHHTTYYNNLLSC